jgi:hypothetical protein
MGRIGTLAYQMTDAQVPAPATAIIIVMKIAASIGDRVHGVRMWITPVLRRPI